MADYIYWGSVVQYKFNTNLNEYDDDDDEYSCSFM